MNYIGKMRLCACLLNISEARNGNIVERVASSALLVNLGKTTGGVEPNHTSPSRGINKNQGLKDCDESQGTWSQGQLKASVLNIFKDHDYNRSVITIVAKPEDIGQSVTNACQTAYRLMDLRQHQGGHPRLGAVDLVPIHPLAAAVSLEECGIIAKGIAENLSQTIPGMSAFLFGSADLPRKRGLVQRRKDVGWYRGKHGVCYEGMKQDVGAPPGGIYGLTGIGAIPYVMNCNVTIDTQDVAFGRQIAASLRATSPGGLVGVQAMAFAHEGKVEIACNVEGIYVDDTSALSKEGNENLTCSFGNYYHVPASTIETRVKEMAAKRSIATVGTALVGFSPEEAQTLAVNALLTGQAEYWRTRTDVPMM